MINRVLAGVLAVSLSLAVPVAAQTMRGGDQIKQARKTLMVPALRIRGEPAIDLLNMRVESVDWEDAPFDQIIDWLKEEGEGMVNIVPRWGPLSVESVDRDTPITLQLNNTTVAIVLNEAIDQLSEDGELRYRAIGNTLKITTRADTDRKKYVRVYDVTDMLFQIPDLGQESPNIDLKKTGNAGGGGGGGGQSVFQGGSSGGGASSRGGRQAEQELVERLTELRQLIEQTVEPQTWDTNAGGVVGSGRIRIFNGSLIVYNTIEVHEKIAGSFSFSQ